MSPVESAEITGREIVTFAQSSFAILFHRHNTTYIDLHGREAQLQRGHLVLSGVMHLYHLFSK